MLLRAKNTRLVRGLAARQPHSRGRTLQLFAHWLAAWPRAQAAAEAAYKVRQHGRVSLRTWLPAGNTCCKELQKHFGSRCRLLSYYVCASKEDAHSSKGLCRSCTIARFSQLRSQVRRMPGFEAVAVVVKGALCVSAAAWALALGCSSARALRQRRRRRHAAARCILRSPCQPGPPAAVQAGWCILVPVLSAWPIFGSKVFLSLSVGTWCFRWFSLQPLQKQRWRSGGTRRCTLS